MPHFFSSNVDKSVEYGYKWWISGPFTRGFVMLMLAYC